MKKYQIFLSLISLMFLLVYCGGKTDKDLFKSAQKNIEQKNYSEALVDFQEYVDENPAGELTPKALYEIGKLYHGKVIKNLTPEESLQKAADYYRMVFDKFEGWKESSRALFMSGFILANELKKYNEAKSTYELFLSKFPDDELALSAKAELQNLGKKPEEILKERLANEKN